MIPFSQLPLEALTTAIMSPCTAVSAPPAEVEYTSVTSTSVSLRWQPPPSDSHNGVIRSYLVEVVERETGNTVSRETTDLELTVAALHPYYNYELSVSAVTVSPGPYSDPLAVQTLEDGTIVLIWQLVMHTR